MPSYSQAGRSLQISTPLGADQLLLVGFRGQESISRLFRFELDLLADINTDIEFQDIIGQGVTVEMLLPNEDTRYFNGIVKRFSQGAQGKTLTINTGPTPLTLTSLTSITLSVAEGLSTITLTPEGIIIKGVLVQIN